MKVDRINNHDVFVKNTRDKYWELSKELMVRDFDSADHFDQTVKCSMTELCELIQQCGDTIFKVQFRCQADPAEVEAKLAGVNHADLCKDDVRSKLAKELMEGSRRELTCRLVKSDTKLGRSIVIDLEAPLNNNHRQVDHRKIEHLIFKNVKYVCDKKAYKEELPLRRKASEPRWDGAKLAVGNWFSQVTYYIIQEVYDNDEVLAVTSANPEGYILLSKSVLLHEMTSGQLYDKTEKISRTRIVEMLVDEAKEAAMTITYDRKVDEAHVKALLEGATQAQLDAPADLKNLAK